MYGHSNTLMEQRIAQQKLGGGVSRPNRDRSSPLPRLLPLPPWQWSPASQAGSLATNRPLTHAPQQP